MRERARAGREQPRCVGGHRTAALDLVAVNRTRVFRRRVVAHLVERPAQIHGGRARLAQHPLGRGEILAVRRRECVAVCGGDPDRGCAANDHRPDRVGYLDGGAALDVDLFERKPALVEEDDVVVLEPEDPLRLEQASPSRASDRAGAAKTSRSRGRDRSGKGPCIAPYPASAAAGAASRRASDRAARST